MDLKKTEGRDEKESRESASRVIAEAIRQGSQKGRFVTHRELFEMLIGRNLLIPGTYATGPAFESLATKTREENQDIKAIPDRDGNLRYYSSLFMSESYRGILLKKEGDALILIAESVRENSAVYSRPLSLEMFGNPPFDLTPGELQVCLERMACCNEYRDIDKITTSAKGVFLYSSYHLEPGHAAMLAEWLDVGQFDHP